MRHNIDTCICIHNRSHLQNEFGPRMEKTLDSLHVGRNIKRIDKQMKVICKAVSVFVNHVGQCMECKRKQSF